MGLVIHRDNGIVKRIEHPLVHDFHFHFRQGLMIRFTVKHLIKNGFVGYVVAEPNTQPPILDGHAARAYRNEIMDACVGRDFKVPDTFTVLPTIQITEKTTPAMVYDAWALGVRIAKVYPRDVTTNSQHGVVNYLNIYDALRAAEKCGMVIQFHGEHPSHDIEGPAKEPSFLIRILTPIAKEFSKLKISVEHVSTAYGIHWIRSMNPDPQEPRIVGALAPQYMYMTSDDVEGYTVRSGYKGHTELICKPKLKWNDDRAAIQAAATSGDYCFVFATDGAVHPARDKGPGSCNCGVFNGPVAIPVAIDVAHERNALHTSPVLLSKAGPKFYDLPELPGTIIVERQSWTVPDHYVVDDTTDTVIPMLARQDIGWKIKEILI